MQKTLITQTLIDSPLISEEELKEQQKLQRKYDIECLRNKIKNDVEEFNLFRTTFNGGEIFNFYHEYLLDQIQINIEKLKELVEQNNEKR